VPFGRPDYEIPDLPRDITIISDDRLMQLFSEYVGWQNYAATEFAMAEVTEERAEADAKRINAMTLVGMNPEKGKITVAQAGRLLSPEVERAEQDRLNAYAARKMTQVVLQNCERCAALISRELSRRIGGSGIERRNMRWNA
jgi:hypothetical protein